MNQHPFGLADSAQADSWPNNRRVRMQWTTFDGTQLTLPPVGSLCWVSVLGAFGNRTKPEIMRRLEFGFYSSTWLISTTPSKTGELFWFPVPSPQQCEAREGLLEAIVDYEHQLAGYRAARRMRRKLLHTRSRYPEDESHPYSRAKRAAEVHALLAADALAKLRRAMEGAL